MCQARSARAPDTTHVAAFGPKGLFPEIAAALAPTGTSVSGDRTGVQASDQKSHTLSVPFPALAGWSSRLTLDCVISVLFEMTWPGGGLLVWLPHH